MPHHDDEIDDIMSSILQRQRGGNPMPKHAPAPKAPKKTFGHNQEFTQPKPSVFDQEASYAPEPHARRKVKKSVKVSIAVIFLVVALAAAGVVLREPIGSAISNLLAPPSPFSQEIKEDVSFPLYYPTKLPEDFKLDTSSIKQPEDGVVIYAVTDDSGKTVNFTMQSQPDGLNLDPLLLVLKDVRDVSTPLGTAKAGTSEQENRVIVNLLTGKTWILVNSPLNTLSNEQLDALLHSLRQG